MYAVTRNNAESLAYQVEQMIGGEDVEIDDEQRKKAEAAIEKVRQAVADEKPLEEINAAVEELTAVSHDISEKIYKKAAEQQSAAGETPPEGEQDPAQPDADAPSVVDVEFEEETSEPEEEVKAEKSQPEKTEAE